ncbi:carbamoyl-phosphate synthase large subunit [Merdimmobilis hominis]|uniref:Carbamoyl phosphate synthase large chain n=1 Tax=uncultured Anaerotruncus sp. TaxID=905011 RepID=A0A6N2TB85_9FIRM|nr:carbamoyl-phosphate synthase large subunit [Merdimmobilis hominis]PWL58376.1 MAG: carbamoyl-phosphate synthase large subunit [Oscillospiraceae bacterium]
MPLRSDIKKVLVIGSGPIVIGQAAEFDYAGTQACRALKEEGLEVVLINSNPATIMTDKAMADHIYIEPLTIDTVKRVIEIEKPDSLLSTLGGQTGLTLSMQLDKEGFLASHNVKLLGANRETIDKAEDRQMFKDTMEEIGQPCIPSKVVENLQDGIDFVGEIGLPVIIRPAFTMGGTGGGIANTMEEFHEIAENGLRLSPITQILVEKCISGWKEIEFEVIRDRKGNSITVCSMENVDPVGVHTGDSIVVAPAVTLSDKEFQMLRSAALNIVGALGVEGGCNCQFALHPTSFEYAVIEVNPRVSRSSALASKATGYPIAKVATKIAIGYTLDEILNAVTGTTYACFEPAIDYLVVKFPKWPFDKFVYGKRTLGTQMKATGEVMSIGVNFEQAMMKAVRSIELKLDTLSMPKLAPHTDEEIHGLLHNCDDERIFVVYEAIKRGISLDEIHRITMIDKWFLSKLQKLAQMEKGLSEGELTQEKYLAAKKNGFLDSTIEKLSGQSCKDFHRSASFKMVDTCAAEFAAKTPYFYSTYDEENEAAQFVEENHSGKKKILVFGAGPIRIGQGIEFDYCSVHCVWALKEEGCEAIIVNNNPETVSTDFDTSDRLYFDPLTPEDVDSILEVEKPWGCVVQFGGQTAIKLTKHLQEKGVNILGTSADSIDAAEDRERFDELLEKCGIPRPAGHTVFTTEEAVKAAEDLEYPVLLRPSYVLGGQNMIIAHSEQDVVEYMEIITSGGLENPVLIDKYMMGTEVEVDAICDGHDYLIPGIMEHIERAGVHSGDSISIYPAQNLSQKIRATIINYTGKLARELNVIGLVNIQYVVYKGEVYVIEVNPRSSRTVPYISKVTGVPMVDLATKIMLGAKLADLGYGTGLYPHADYVAVKVPVFSFEKLHDVDVHLGPEMKSTGEVLGIGRTFEEALLKGLSAAGYKMTGEKKGGVLITVRDSDKQEIIPIAEKFEALGFTIYATSGTALTLNSNMVAANTVRKLEEGTPNILDLFEEDKIDYVISTSSKGRKPMEHAVQMRRKAVERSIPCLTSLDTANALANCLSQHRGMEDVQLVDITTI